MSWAQKCQPARRGSTRAYRLPTNIFNTKQQTWGTRGSPLPKGRGGSCVRVF